MIAKSISRVCIALFTVGLFVNVSANASSIANAQMVDVEWPQLDQVYTSYNQLSAAITENNMELARELTGQLARYTKILAANPVPAGWEGSPNSKMTMDVSIQCSQLAYEATTQKISDDDLVAKITELGVLLNGWK